MYLCVYATGYSEGHLPSDDRPLGQYATRVAQTPCPSSVQWQPATREVNEFPPLLPVRCPECQ
jgi:hypothetical protein